VKGDKVLSGFRDATLHWKYAMPVTEPPIM